MKELPAEIVETLTNIQKDIEKMFDQLTSDQINALVMIGAKHAYLRGTRDTTEWMLKEINKEALKTIKEGEE